MPLRIAPLAAFNLVLVVLIAAIGLPGLFADAVRLPSEVTIHEVRAGRPVTQAADETAIGRLGWAALTSNAARNDLALAMLADAADPQSTEYRAAGDHAARQLRTYLAAAPDNSRAWANLALAETRRGTGGAAVVPFKMSVELAPYSAVDLAWRCGFGLDLYPLLDDDGKAMLARQFRLAMDDGLDTAISERVARTVWEHSAIPLVWGFVADDPGAAERFTRMLARMKMSHRVLIHRPGSLGDTVIALPCLRLVRRRFPDSEIRVLTNAPVADSAPPLRAVLDGSGLIDGYLEYPIQLRSLPRLWRLAGEIRRWRPDLLVYMARRETKPQVWRDAMFFRACGIRDFVGQAFSRDRIVSRTLADGTFEREADRLVRNLAALGPVDLTDPASWDLGLTEADRALPRRLIAERIGGQPFIALCAGTKQPTNDWGLVNWRALAGQLNLVHPHRLVFVGAEGDRETSDAIACGLGEDCVNLCGLLTVRESAALIAAASLFIGVDSGPMHLAAAVGTPLVAIFSRLNLPGIWFPTARDAKLLYPYEDWATVQAITPPMVVEAAQALLPAGMGARRLAGEW